MKVRLASRSTCASCVPERWTVIRRTAVRFGVLIWLVSTFAVASMWVSRLAQAQYGLGLGRGYGGMFGAKILSDSITSRYNTTPGYQAQLDQYRAEAAFRSRERQQVRTNAPYRFSSGPVYQQRYDVATRGRVTMPESAVPRRDLASQEAEPVPPLAQFLGPDRAIDWPRDVTAVEDLAEERERTETRIGEVVLEAERYGQARVVTANAARTELIAFGRDVLQRAQDQRSRQVVVLLHDFFLNLNRAIQRAGDRPETSEN